MKKITSKNLGKKLASYGALTVAIAGVSDATGQIQYTDVDPDETLTGTRFMLDLNGDAIVDYEISNDGVLSGATPGTTARIYTSTGNANSVLGMNAGGNYNYPFALSEGSPIDGAEAEWIANANYQTLNWQGCAYTNSQWCDGQVDKYAALRVNVGGDQLYGWVRMDIPADASTITIKDYAFNTVAGEGLEAGDGVLGLNDNDFAPLVYFVADSKLNVSTQGNLENITLYSLTGQQVSNKNLSGNDGAVDISSLAAGMYVANITVDGAQRSIKIVKK